MHLPLRSVPPLSVQAVTPIRCSRLAFWLADYEVLTYKELIEGFAYGFRVHADVLTTSITSPNSRSALLHPQIIDEKLDKGLKDGIISGPFTTPPMDPFIISPLGLVPKQTPGQWRLIHNLSFPLGSSVNDAIPGEFSRVSYETLDHALDIVASLGPGCYIAKTDIQSAFHLLPIHPDDRYLLGFSWQDNLYHYNVAAMGCSSSCRSFELQNMYLVLHCSGFCKTNSRSSMFLIYWMISCFLLQQSTSVANIYMHFMH
jgi:hypothetical protein